ncbi:MAG: PDGLE domain-containing protein [Candidatus Altiarchaeota archaeon]|nr:PDGLE domain-containing protein [Candidatus Altiarchaeota archaeon]
MVKYWHIGLAAALLVGGIISLFASPEPDGLERVAEDNEFIDKGGNVISAPMPDYLAPGVEDEYLSASLAGVVGVLATFGFVVLIGNVLKKWNTTS